MQFYKKVCSDCSKLITERYSTSFSIGIKSLDKRFQEPIYAIYGYVRFADEIVDTFHDYDKQELLNQFRADTYAAIESGMSLNPVLHCFQSVVSKYSIERELIDAFLDSMEMDIYKCEYESNCFKDYIYGSAEVVGLMCLKIFVEGDNQQYLTLQETAQKLGSAFQKVNFLRDMKSDYEERGRVYFPNIEYSQFSQADKEKIEDDIEADFEKAYQGIIILPEGAKFGVYTSYIYYRSLFKKIRRSSVDHILNQRIRVPNVEKFYLLMKSAVKMQFNAI